MKKQSKDTPKVLEARIKTYLLLAIASAKQPTVSAEYNRLAELAEKELETLIQKQAKKRATV